MRKALRGRLELPSLHVIARRNQQIGRPQYFLAQPIEYRCRRLGNSIVAIPLCAPCGRMR